MLSSLHGACVRAPVRARPCARVRARASVPMYAYARRVLLRHQGADGGLYNGPNFYTSVYYPAKSLMDLADCLQACGRAADASALEPQIGACLKDLLGRGDNIGRADRHAPSTRPVSAPARAWCARVARARGVSRVRPPARPPACPSICVSVCVRPGECACACACACLRE